MKIFDRFLDTNAMRQLFQQWLPGIVGTDLQISHCHVLHSQFYTSVKHPQKSRLGLCYQLSGVDIQTLVPWQQLFYARARVDGQSAADFAEARKNELWQPAIGQPITHLPEHDLTLWAFPNDPQLPHLQQVIDCERVKQHLPYATLPECLHSPAAIRNLNTEVVHYYPEERCLCRYELGGETREGETVRIAIFGKTFKNCEGAKIYQRLCEAWKYTQYHPRSFRVAQPLGYAKEVHTVWLREEAGAPFSCAINPGNAAALMAKVALGLLALQSSDLPTSGEIGLAELLAEIEYKVQKLMHALPDQSELLAAQLADLHSQAQRLPACEPRLLHGDFHIRQLLADGDEIVFLDFDEFAIGDPLRDVANFIVDLYYANFGLLFVRQMSVQLFESYRQSANFPISVERLHWHLRYLFLTKAYRAYRQHKPNLAEIVEESLLMADMACGLFK